MLSETDEQILRQRLLTMRIIAGGLLLGVLIFLGFVLFQVDVQGQGIQPVAGESVLSLVAMVLLATNVPLSLLVPVWQTRMALRRIADGTWQAPRNTAPSDFATDVGKLLAVRQTGMILGMALMEGVALLGCIAYLLEGQPIPLTVTGVALVLMLLHFPTEGRVRAWLQTQIDRLAELRQETALAPERKMR